MQVEANGISMHCRIGGPCEDPSAVSTLRQTRSTVTLSHSLATSLNIWGPQTAALASRFRVLRYDTRGHGRTEVPDGAYTLDTLVEDARGLLLSFGHHQDPFPRDHPGRHGGPAACCHVSGDAVEPNPV